MIVVDLETSGVKPEKCGIWQIGAIDLLNLESMFLEDCRVDDDDIITDESLEICGKTHEEFLDSKKQTQKEMLEHFFKWCEKAKMRNFVCQNPQFDLGFLLMKARKYRIEMPMHYRAFDLHTLAQTKYYELKKAFLVESNKIDSYSGMGLSNTLEFCGIQDERIQFEKGEKTREGKPHNALEDAKLTAECFSRLLAGKNLLKEFEKFPVPDYLKSSAKIDKGE